MGGSLTSYVADKWQKAQAAGLFLSEDEARYFFTQFLHAVKVRARVGVRVCRRARGAAHAVRACRRGGGGVRSPHTLHPARSVLPHALRRAPRPQA